MPRTAATVEVMQVPKPTAIVSGASFYRTSSQSKAGRLPKEASDWQDQCWAYRDTVGELRYAVSWFSNAISRAVLRVVKRKADGSLETITSGPAVDTLEAILGADQSQMLKAMGEHYFIAGEWYLIGLNLDSPDEDWMVLSPSEITKTGKRYTIQFGNGDSMKIEPEDDAAVIRIHNPHPRRKSHADSPVRAVLSNLNEVASLSSHIAAQVRSRLSGAGVLAVPNEISFSTYNEANGPDAASGSDPFMQVLGETMSLAITNPGDVSALVPIILRVPGEHIDKIRHITFWSALDEKAADLRDKAIRRLALGLDLPPEVLLGTADVNHWGAWQIEESTIKAHIEPALNVIAAGMTAMLREALDGDDVLVAYDTSALRLRPNRSKEAMELYDRGRINSAALLRETGFSSEDEMSEDERKEWLLQKVAAGSATPEQVTAALALLGVDLPLIESGEALRETRPDPSLRDHKEQGPPEQDAPDFSALRATCDAVALRAMERVGNRIRSRQKVRPPGVDPADLYQHVTVRPGEADDLLEGAWTVLPRLLEGTDYDVSRVEASIDSYMRMLLTTQERHDPNKMMRMILSGVSA